MKLALIELYGVVWQNPASLIYGGMASTSNAVCVINVSHSVSVKTLQYNLICWIVKCYLNNTDGWYSGDRPQLSKTLSTLVIDKAFSYFIFS